MTDFEVLTGFECAFDDFDKGIDGLAGFFAGKSRLIGHGPNDMCFC
jgi:hypothetical protein